MGILMIMGIVRNARLMVIMVMMKIDTLHRRDSVSQRVMACNHPPSQGWRQKCGQHQSKQGVRQQLSCANWHATHYIRNS